MVFSIESFTAFSTNLNSNRENESIHSMGSFILLNFINNRVIECDRAYLRFITAVYNKM